MESNLSNRIDDAYKLAIKDKIEQNLLFELANDCIANQSDQESSHKFLELAHLSNVSNLINERNKTEEWFDIIHKIIVFSNFHFGFLLKQRSIKYKNKIAFNLIEENEVVNISYEQLWMKVIEVEKAIRSMKNNRNNIGILSSNNLNGVLVDFSCLSFNHKVIPIPVNSTPEHILYIIDHSEIDIIFISGDNPVQFLNNYEIKKDIKIVYLDENYYTQNKLAALSWDAFIQKGDLLQNFDINKSLNQSEMGSVATIMYTSGTTDNPKGIIFNHTNLITKRFARAFALPNINSEDIFLCYLPLFHTFGRFFELMGSIFWGATYSFAQSPAFNTLLEDFKIIKPSIFISIPKRWVQLYELIQTKVDIDISDDKEIYKELTKITGGQLRLGLSAAGYLDPEIFNFFQNNKINLLSGYGMTEATGGITMTPENDYKENSVGKALPGVQLRLEKDGELCIKGPYVSSGYYKDNNSTLFKDGWFHTQDIFYEKLKHYFIVDRKKDIYKNSRGQTVAPQKIENLFQDFEYIKSVFLVGDGKEYNTLLIYPNYNHESHNLKNLNSQKIRNLFSSMILSVNSFLSPYERIVNYVVINRDFSNELDELTSKNTFKRKNILQNFKEIISPLYEKNYTSLYYNTKELRVPNWLLREIGFIKTNLNWDGVYLSIEGQNKKLIIRWNNRSIQIGDFFYENEIDTLDIGRFIQEPNLWLGNFQFSDFTGNSIFRLKQSKNYKELNSIDIITGTSFGKVEIDRKNNDKLYQLHAIIRKFINDDSSVFDDLKKLIDVGLGTWDGVALKTFLRYQKHSNPYFRIKFLESIAPILSGDILIRSLNDSYEYQKSIDSTKGFSFDIKRTSEEHYQSFIKYLNKSIISISKKNEVEKDFIKIILLMVADFGISHPTKFVWARSELINWHLQSIPKPIYSTAQKAYYSLINGFRSWIGTSSSITVDFETGNEYGWKDVIQFDDNVRTDKKIKILKIFEETSIIRESIFLFSKSYIIGLNDIPLNGIWVSLIDNKGGKSVFRVLIKTRTFGTHNIIINLNNELSKEFMDEETKLLIKMSAGLEEKSLVENFGGFWPEYGIYSEEFVQGETVENYLQRNKNEIQDISKVDRWQMRWLHFIWSGIQAYQEFWFRSNFQFAIQPPSIENLIIPHHDYKVGTTLISISNRKKVTSIAEHFILLYTDYIIKTERRFQGLKKMSDWEVIFTATLEAIKLKKGIEVLKKLKLEIQKSDIAKRANAIGLTELRINEFLNDVEKYGVLIKPVIFASLRYERWLELNPNATLNARAAILQELYGDYNLDHFVDDYPETRVRFFMMNCFKHSSEDLKSSFQKIIKDMRGKDLSPWNLHERITLIQSEINLNETENFFLARMLFPHVDSAEYVELVTTQYGKTEKLNLVMQTECLDGKIYNIRPPFIPKEIAHFHTILIESSLSITFTSEHDFLLAFNNRNRIAGGLYWKRIDYETVHLEWVAIKDKYQKISLSKRLMSEFFKRKKHQGIKIVTVGFYAETFFAKHGFKIDKRFAGFVRKI